MAHLKIARPYQLKTVVFLSLLFFFITSGTYRHDRPIEKYLALAQQEQFKCVGQVLSFDTKSWSQAGSFVMIDSLHLLSAAHVFVGEDYKDTVIKYNGMDVKTKVPIRKYVKEPGTFSFLIMNCVFKAKRITLHPSYLKNASCDLAIIKLDKPCHLAQTLALNKTPDEMRDTVTGVGFGVSGPANRPDLVNAYFIKLAGQNIIDSIGGTAVNNSGSMLYADFDSPDVRENCNKLGDSKPLDLEYSSGGGDSGGPLFRTKNKSLQLVGITSFGNHSIADILKNGYYCQIMGWTRICTLYDWIEKNRN